MKLFAALCHLFGVHRPFWKYIIRNNVRVCTHCGVEQYWGEYTKRWKVSGR